uniref:C2H2-type domain-containing protein n=1 Tax=Aplanochytrium stocchinoi TaxID=215587 RepID=A0A7S3UYW0_9STRA|mmetsp:Transcript_8751/g.11041  ORF Transcript_8751/g.11041 Transcript_8751/m.11041 type:complete len:123 (-) Transcript_8751:291-659(-)|eukprot:CAMPEP_0204828684 /NCGR_PEP_ID=MMETSP1346-20131115/6582_1 /ASSEMBLY_ACC=CAM_ASM_000771 /TAXON_ID=215587 /ORGANISM="Aplanochytrium stocchinoi, Strain GSBS06" /LENGTH=122 /DNA_ID=CAMNT_0051957951 /DNA_START=161 /DNA_END=529 /DNA_ORIENTATION=+
MGRKGKTQKHTAKEIATKVKAAKEKNGAAGGGGKGAEARKGAWTKASVFCELCKTIQPSAKTMQIHYDSKHPKDPYPADEYETKFAEARGKVKPDKKGKKPLDGADKKSKSKKNDLSLLDGY